MAITSIKRDFDTPTIVRIVSSDTLAIILTTGYLTDEKDNIEALNHGPFDWEVTDMVLVAGSDGDSFATISTDFQSLIIFSFTDSVVGTPVTVGDFAVFSSTSGILKDGSYSPSDPAKSKVVMQANVSTAGHLSKYVDANGTIDDAGFSVLAKTTAAFAGGGTTSAYAAAGLTSSSIVVASILNSTNVVTIVKVVPSTNTLTVSFSGDPGAATTVSYVAITPAV